MKKTVSILIVSVLVVVAVSACGDDSAEGDQRPTVDVKYPELPEEGPVELSVPPEAVLLGAVDITVKPEEMKRYRFTKESGYAYLVGLTGLTNDLDLYTHWIPEVSVANHHQNSWADGLEEEQIVVHATVDGDYYIGVHGYRGGGEARLELYRWLPEDEVGWPIPWGHDDATLDELVGNEDDGGYRWLEDCSGLSCKGFLCHHPGLDFNTNGDKGMPVYAVANGKIEAAVGDAPGWGGLVMINHELTSGLRFNSQYGHLDRVDVKSGQSVVRGQQIGTVGSPPGADAPHLHFELRQDLSIGATAYICGMSESNVESYYIEPVEFIRSY